MIGRFSKLGVYQELFRLRDFYLAAAAAVWSLLGMSAAIDLQVPQDYGLVV